MSNIETYKRALAREKQARKLAEKIIEEKSLELYSSNQELRRINTSIENEVSIRSAEMQDLFNNMYDGYVSVDNQAKVIKSNKAARVILGFPESEEIENLFLKDIIHEGDVEKSKIYLNRLITEGFYSEYVGRIYDKQGNIKYIEVNSNAIYNEQKEIIGSRDIIRDVTRKMEAEIELEESRNQLRAVFENKTVGIALFNDKGAFVNINDTFCRQLGYESSFFDTRTARSVVHPDEQELYLNKILGIYKGDINEIQVENRYVKKSGSFFWANSNVSGIYDQNNKLVYYVLLVEDITAKKIAEQQLRLQEEKYRNIIANMNLGLLEVDNNDKIQYANQGFINMSGFVEDELVGKEAKKLFVLEEHVKTIESKNEIRAKGESDAYELKVETKNGEKKWWLISGAPRYNDSGELVGSIGIHLDITEQKETQKKLQQSLQQLEVANNDLKDFAHVVSHDLKSPLRSISGLVQILQEDYADKFDLDGQQIVEDVITRTEHMDELIGGILSYSSVQHSHEKYKVFDSKELIEKLVKYLDIPVHFELHLEGSFPCLRMNPTHFQQLIQNFITNSIKYNDKDLGRINIRAEVNAHNYIFEIEDNGNGIDKRNQKKIFDMFQKFDAQGKSSSGIGLAIVKKIVELYKGSLSLHSEVGVGSTFSFQLPKN